MKYKAAMFDMDGVIFDSEKLHMVAFQATLKRFGYSLSEIDYKLYFAGKTDEAGFEAYFKHINKSVDLPLILSEKAKKYLELASNQLVPYPGVVPLITSLADNILLALVTGSLRAEAELALKAFDIADCFKVIVAAENISQSKPNPEGYIKAQSILGVPPDKCVIIEDSPNGIKAAIAAEMDCIAVTNTHSAKDLQDATNIVDLLDISMFLNT